MSVCVCVKLEREREREQTVKRSDIEVLSLSVMVCSGLPLSATSTLAAPYARCRATGTVPATATRSTVPVLSVSTFSTVRLGCIWSTNVCRPGSATTLPSASTTDAAARVCIVPATYTCHAPAASAPAASDVSDTRASVIANTSPVPTRCTTPHCPLAHATTVVPTVVAVAVCARYTSCVAAMHAHTGR